MFLMRLNENSGTFAQWFTIIPLGFGIGVSLQTMLIGLLVHVDESAMPVAAGFVQLCRSLGQVCGVAFASAILQSILKRELTKRITGPDAADMIYRIRHSSRLVVTLPPNLQQHAQASYKIALQMVFTFAACSCFSAFLIRLTIPEKSLDQAHVPDTHSRTVKGSDDIEWEPQAPLSPDVSRGGVSAASSCVKEDEDEVMPVV